MVRAKTAKRVGRLRERIGEGCPACKGWPRVWVLGIGSPEPPEGCVRCGRRFAGLIRVYVGVDDDAI